GGPARSGRGHRPRLRGFKEILEGRHDGVREDDFYMIGVFPRHLPVLTRIVPGEIIARTTDGDEFLAVGEGIVEITGDRVAIATDMAVGVKDIDEARVEEARRRAEARLHDKISDEEVATVNASLARSLAQLRVKRRRRG